MMPFFEGNLNHLARPQGSAGPTASFGENFWAAYDQQYRVDSMLSLESELATRYNENLRRVQELTGEDLSLPSFNELDYLGVAARRALGQDLSSMTTPSELVPSFLSEFDKREERLAELRQQYPEIQSFGDLLEDVRKARQEVMETSADAAARSGFVGTLGQFAGGVVGSFSWRDPLLVGSLFLGGWGTTLAKRLMTEAGVGMAVEGVQQFGFVQPTQDALGEEGTNPWLSIAAAGVGAAVFRGAVEAPVPAYRALEARLAPQRAYARAIDQVLSGPMDLAAFDRAFAHAPDTPSLRAARSAVETSDVLRASNPYGDSIVAQQRFLEELDQAYDLMSGRSTVAPRPDLEPVRLPQFMEEASFDRALARSEFPIQAERLDLAEARLAEADARIVALEEGINNRTVADAVELVDEVSGLRVREIEEEMARPGARVEELEAELDMIVESIGPDAIARAEQDWRIGPRRQLADARRSRQAAKKEVNRAQRDVDRLMSGLRARDADEQTVARLMDTTVRRGQPEMVEGVRAVAEVEERLDEIGEGIVERNVPRAAEDGAPTTPLEDVDVGLPENLPPNFTVAVGDDAGNSLTMTARAVMNDLDEDRAMLEAMRTCAI